MDLAGPVYGAGMNRHGNYEGQIYAAPGLGGAQHVRQSSMSGPINDRLAFNSGSAAHHSRKYQRTMSFDANYGQAGLYGQPHTQWNPLMGAHQRVHSALVLGSQYNLAPQPEMYDRLPHRPDQTMDVTGFDYGPSRLYKPHPVTYNYEANSYIGWHRRSLPVRIRTENPELPTVSGGIDGSCQKEPDPDRGNGYASYEPDFMPQSNPYMPPEPLFNSQIYGSFPAGSSDTQTTNLSPSKSKMRLWIILCVMVIMVAVIIAMAVAVYSQVKTQNSAFHYVCQYEGSFLITHGGVIDFDSSLLNPRTSRHKALAGTIKRALDLVFSQSEIHRDYEGTEIESFRYIVAQPALEVRFLIKTKITSTATSQDLLLALHQALTQSGRSLFHEFTVDPDSVQIQGQAPA